MFDDLEEIDLPDEYVWLTTIKVCRDGEGQFFVIMEKPTDEMDDLSSSVIMLPEMVQNLIPVYLPMLIGE